MLRDISFRFGEIFAVIAVPEIHRLPQMWKVFLWHRGDEPVSHVLLMAWGEFPERIEPATTTFRFYWEHVPPGDSYYLETIFQHTPSLLHRYLLSYIWQNHLYEQWLVLHDALLVVENIVTIPGFAFRGILASTQRKLLPPFRGRRKNSGHR